jgi:hypothetical protein
MSDVPVRYDAVGTLYVGHGSKKCFVCPFLKGHYHQILTHLWIDLRMYKSC